MKRYTAGQKVSGGYYWRLANWEIVPVKGAEGPLPGAPGEAYWALPLFAIPIAIALTATFFCMFYIPSVGFGMVAKAVWAKLTGQNGQKAPEKAEDAVPPAHP